MRILHINSCNFGSTGNIVLGIIRLAEQKKNECAMGVPLQRSNCKKEIKGQIFIGNRVSRNIHLQLSRITGYNGCFSIFATKHFVEKIERYKPDIIHLHNLHNGYINLRMLFRYIKEHDIPIVWTLHDCWAFTGQCPHFTMVKCDKWKTGCHDCTQYRQYPESYVDRTKTMWKLKKKWFTGVQNMTIITPSQWLADLAKESYLKDYPVKVIHNGIDLSVFRPTPSDFREKYGIGDKYIVLGVAFGWGERKGLDVFLELAKRLDPETYQIVLVGTDDRADRQLPKQILSIHRTQNQKELAEIYTAADVFANPTREDNYPTVNMEAIACGTPVVTFDTGGSPESLDDSCGSVVPCDDVDALEREILRICETRPYTAQACQRRAEEFDQNVKYQEYIALYEELCGKR